MIIVAQPLSARQCSGLRVTAIEVALNGDGIVTRSTLVTKATLTSLRYRVDLVMDGFVDWLDEAIHNGETLRPKKVLELLSAAQSAEVTRFPTRREQWKALMYADAIEREPCCECACHDTEGRD